jgi:TonB-linked SusC/RagA family outer membrane protein
MLNDKEKIDVDFREAKLEEVLHFLLDKRGFSWVYNGTYISVSPQKKESQGGKHTSPRGDTSATAQIIVGSVTDAGGGPLIGATVQVKGTGIGTTTDVDGKFAMSKIGNNSILVISSLGYETREVAVKGKSIMVQLNMIVNDLDETVIKGYYSTTRRLNTGNVNSIKANEIEKQPVSNPLQALQARVPGLIITQETGVAGGGFKVQLRGRNSIASGNDPLYLIDGVPFAAEIVASIGGNIIGGGNPFNFINPSDIESIDILKDADATAIYGSRGANGVILVTTKKGKPGKTRIDFNIYRGIGQITRKMDLLNLNEYLRMRHEAFRNDGVMPGAFDYDINGTWDSTRSTDWQKTFIGGTAHHTDIQASVSGGSANTQYLIGAGYRKETTVFPGSFSDQKGTVHFSIASQSTDKKFKVALSGSFTADNNNLPAYDLTGGNVALSPNAPPLHNADGTLNWANSTWDNPLALLEQKYRLKARNLVSNLLLSYEVLPGLEVKTNAGYTNSQLDEIATTPTTFFNPAYNIKTGTAVFSNRNVQSWIAEPQLSYQLRIGKGDLSVFAGATVQENLINGQVVEGKGYTSDALLKSLQGAATIVKGAFTNTVYRYNALFARFSYNMANRYVVNLTARRDGSSRFGPGRQFGNFAAVGAAWIFSGEEFVAKSLPFLSFGKLRGSYGTSGNDKIGDYQYLSLYNFTTGVPYQGATGIYPINHFNEAFAWEVNKKVEAGLELGVLSDKIILSCSYFRNRSSNQLIGAALPDVTGFQSVLTNFPATLQNAGWEITLTTTNIRKKSFSWTTAFNLTFSRNKLVSFRGIENTAYASLLEIGQPVNIIRTFHLIGVNDTSGIYQFADSKGQPTYTPDEVKDRISFVNTNPRFYGGLQNGLQYKNFQLDFLFQFVKQTGLNNLFMDYYPPGMTYFRNQPEDVLDRWKKPGDKATFQKFTQAFGDAFSAYKIAQRSDYAYSDASFVRLKNISFSYQLPEQLKSKLRLQNCRLYIQGQNVLTITRYKGMDPENQTVTGIPPLKVWVAGIQLSL